MRSYSSELRTSCSYVTRHGSPAEKAAPCRSAAASLFPQLLPRSGLKLKGSKAQAACALRIPSAAGNAAQRVGKAPGGQRRVPELPPSSHPQPSRSVQIGTKEAGQCTGGDENEPQPSPFGSLPRRDPSAHHTLPREAPASTWWAPALQLCPPCRSDHPAPDVSTESCG